MGICASELRQWVIKPTLKRLGVYSKAAENLLLATAAQESGLGSHLKPAGQRALGIYQIHSLAHRHIWDDYLALHSDMASLVRGLASQHDFLTQPHAELATNLSYATAIAWFMYARNENFSLPKSNDIEAMAVLWKRFYHPKSKSSTKDFCKNFEHYVIAEEVAA
ncbi:conserved hypothetical protein [Oleispira antarctica RB-8]|uniref:Transglycosylase SLT domain-containing protein n=1 Tax=Oleispira antarctica RB-8 TaxID=698738 RepID=R4YLU2_OLEAN|nr:conserved hypothetical protein [Oleispira antarctica RB-8]|tara:strand:+ start:1987 stop:2481 length:495 start_codon:yes stop_codon:yes gene_type:complete